MGTHRRDLLVARICSGTVRIRAWGQVFLVKQPSPEQLYQAQEVYQEQLYTAELEGLFRDDELLAHLLDSECWDDERERMLQSLPKELEDFKVKLYQANFKSNEKKVVRKAIGIARAKLAELEGQRRGLDHLSCSGVASMARTRSLMAWSLHDSSGKPVFSNEKAFSEDTSGLVDAALAAYMASRLDEATFRELARTDPWRPIWACRKAHESLFGAPLIRYTDEQRSLVSFSSLYDSIYEHPDCPPDSVVEDDDLLDGWLILQRREREKRLNTRDGESGITNERIRNSQEVFLVAETVEDAAKVMDLNTEHGKAIQKRRFDYLRKHGQVNELDMPDTRQRLQMELNRRANAAVAGT